MKTLEEFAIKEIEDLRKENCNLKTLVEVLESNLELSKSKLEAFIKNVKEDFGIKLSKYQGSCLIMSNSIWENSNQREYNYYKNIFNLEEGNGKINE